MNLLHNYIGTLFMTYPLQNNAYFGMPCFFLVVDAVELRMHKVLRLWLNIHTPSYLLPLVYQLTPAFNAQFCEG